MVPVALFCFVVADLGLFGFNLGVTARSVMLAVEPVDAMQ